MYSFFSSVETFTVKNQVHEQIFSLLGNAGKTLFSTESYLYTELRSPWYQKALTTMTDIWNTPYKKVLTYIGIILASTLMAPPATSFANSVQPTTFIVTAYYSPLPGQSFYLKGNYEAEKRLNGNGTHGASGKPVFAGMIAAPKSYSFGTQIFFEGMGVGTVADRGGAIVEAWDRGQAYDRIDIWMGSGESGLRRAMAWGRREVKGTIITTEDTSNMNPMDIYGIDNGRVNLSLYPSVRSSANGGVSSDVLSAFADLGYIVENGDVKKMLTSFQLDHAII
jgi:3D (Asp-Asp-Asp) domain-containing protein